MPLTSEAPAMPPTPAERDAFKELFGRRIVAAMEAGSISRAQLVFALSTPERLVSESDVRRWSSGHVVPRADRLPGLAKALGVTVDYLIGNADNPLGVVVPGWGEVGFAPESVNDVLKDLAAGVETRSGAGASHSSTEAGQSPSPARARRARRPKSS